MPSRPERVNLEQYPNLRLPVSLLIRYLFFLTRRPISRSNTHYLSNRLAGLKTLAGPLQNTGIIYMDEALIHLNAMNPINFYRLAERLQFTLLPLTQTIDELPHDMRITNNPPQPSFFKDSRRILLLLGPAIGIGDETILFPLPGWIKAAHPHVEITVLSAYQDLWSRINGVDACLHYSDYHSMLPALRGEPPYSPYDLVILADFERPDLYPSICHEARLPRYVELSLGAQSLFIVDNLQRWVHRAPRVAPYFSNFYYGLDYLASWLGLSPPTAGRFSAILQRHPRPSYGPLRVFVSPFTSKHDPYQPYWSRLICSLFPQPLERGVQFMLDPGPNHETRRFANDLLRSARARLPSEIDLQVIEPEERLPLPFQEVFAHLEKSHVVLCSDSFIAHAAPVFDCTTFVIYRAGLEKWHVPHPSSFYFDAEIPCDHIAFGIQQVLKNLSQAVPSQQASPAQPPGLMLDLEAVQAMESITQVFSGLLAAAPHNGSFETLNTAYADFTKAFNVVLDCLDELPPELNSLFSDFAYQKFRRSANHSPTIPNHLQPDLALHMLDHYQQWQNTNLKKYLSVVLSASNPAGAISAGSEVRLNEPRNQTFV